MFYLVFLVLFLVFAFTFLQSTDSNLDSWDPLKEDFKSNKFGDRDTRRVCIHPPLNFQFYLTLKQLLLSTYQHSVYVKVASFNSEVLVALFKC